VNDVFGVGRPQLGTDSTVELLKRIVQPWDRLLIRILVGARISPFLTLDSDRIGMVHYTSSGNLDAPTSD
jgi:hypothetical protein